MLVVTMWVLYK